MYVVIVDRKPGGVGGIFFPLCPKGSLTSVCLSGIGIDFLHPSARTFAL